MSDNSSKETLLPCPFCGVKAKARESSNWAGHWIIGCTSVRCSFQPEIQHHDKSYEIRQWNRRMSK